MVGLAGQPGEGNVFESLRKGGFIGDDVNEGKLVPFNSICASAHDLFDFASDMTFDAFPPFLSLESAGNSSSLFELLLRSSLESFP